MSLLPQLESGWAVDQAIVTEEERVVVIRFGTDYDLDCLRMDEDCLVKIQDLVRNFAVIYTVDIVKVPCFNQMYDLVDPMTVMFFYRNNHIKVDFGTGDNNKLTWFIPKLDFVHLLQAVYSGATQGRGIVQSPQDYSNMSKM